MNIQLFGIIKNLSQAVLLTLLLGFTHSSYGATQSNPQVVLEQAAKNTIKRIELDKQIIDANPKHLHLIIEQELMPHIDHQFAAFKVLGKQFRSVPKAKIPEFVEQFRLYLIANFAGALASYGGQALIFEPAKVATSAKSLTVKAIIRESGHPDIHLNFKLRKNKKTQEWKTFDLVAEGISLLSSKQTEFSSIMRREGIQAVIDLMKSKNSQQLLSNVTAE